MIQALARAEMMRTSDLRQRMGEAPHCLLCNQAFDELRRSGLIDIAHMMRQLAEAIWTDQSLSSQKRLSLNDHFAALVRTLPGNSCGARAEVSMLLADIEKAIAGESPITGLWPEFRELVEEAIQG